jgi:hypothetical protein
MIHLIPDLPSFESGILGLNLCDIGLEAKWVLKA